MDDLVFIRGNLYQIQRLSGNEMAIYCLSTGTEIQRISVNNNEILCYTKFNVKYYDLILVYQDELAIYSCVNQDVHHFHWVPTTTVPLYHEDYSSKMNYDFSSPYFITYSETYGTNSGVLLTLNDIDFSTKYSFNSDKNEEYKYHVSIAKLSVESDYLSIVTVNEVNEHLLYIIDLNSLHNLIPSKVIDDNDDSVSIYSDISGSTTIETINLILPTRPNVETGFHYTITILGSAEINHFVWKPRNNNISSLFFTLNNNYDHIKIWSVSKNDPALLNATNQEALCTIDTQMILEIPISHLVITTPAINNNERILINWIEQLACTSTEFEFYGAMRTKETSRASNKNINQTEGDWLSIIYPVKTSDNKPTKKQNARSGVSIILVSKQDKNTITASEVGTGILLEADSYSNKYAVGSYVIGKFRSNVRGYPVAFDIITKNADISMKNKSSTIILQQSFVVEHNNDAVTSKELSFTLIKDNAIQVGREHFLSNQTTLTPMYNALSNSNSIARVTLIPINPNGVYQVHIDRIDCSDKNSLQLWRLRNHRYSKGIYDEYKNDDYSVLDCAVFAASNACIRQAISLVPSNQLIINTISGDHQRICLSLLCLDDQRSRNQSDASDTANNMEATYNLEVAPSPLYGLGVRLEGKTHTNGMPISCIQSFRKHPNTGEKLHIEKTGVVEVGDEVLAVNGITLRGLELAETIKTIRNLIQTSLGKPMKLVIARKITPVKSSTLLACSKKRYRRWNLEKQINIPMNSISVHVSNTPICDGNGHLRLPVAVIIPGDNDPRLVLYLLNPIDGAIKECLSVAMLPVETTFYDVKIWPQISSSNQIYVTVMSKNANQTCLNVYHFTIIHHDDVTISNDWVVTLPVVGLSEKVNWVPITTPFCCGNNKKHCFFISNNCECNNTVAVFELSLSPNSDYINDVSSDITYSKFIQYIELPVSDITMSINSIQWIDGSSIYVTTNCELYIFVFENGKYKLNSNAVCDNVITAGSTSWSVYPGNHVESLLSKHCIDSLVKTELEENSLISTNGIAELFGLFYSLLSNETVTVNGINEFLTSVQSTIMTPIDTLITCYADSIRSASDVPSATITAAMIVSLSSIIRHGKYSAIEENSWRNLIQYLLQHYRFDTAAVRGLLLVQMRQVIREVAGARKRTPIVDCVSAASMLVSGSQKELLYALVERPWMQRIGNNSDDILNDIADAMLLNTGDNEYDIMGYLCECNVQYWCHDMTPLFKLIESVALQQFKVNKCAIDVYLEMVLLGKTDTLQQFCKIDKSESSQQLLKLLKIYAEYTDSAAILRKNAFALMRLGRYKHAAATFLLIQPPLIEEACSILAKQFGNPNYAFLLSRLFECKAVNNVNQSNGYILGSVSRNLIDKIILPSVKEKVTDTASYSADDAAFTVLCSMWFQDSTILSANTTQFAFINASHNGQKNEIDSVENILSAIAYCSWCLQYLSSDSYLTKISHYTLLSIANTYELHDIVVKIANDYKDVSKYKAAFNSYLVHCKAVYEKYTSSIAVEVYKTVEPVKPVEEEAPSDIPVTYKASSGFNFSGGNSMKPAVSASSENMASALDWF